MKSINNKIILVAVLSNILSFDKEGKSRLDIPTDETFNQLKNFADVLATNSRIEVVTDKETLDTYGGKLALITDRITVVPANEDGSLHVYTDENVDPIIKNEDFNKIVYVLGGRDLHLAMIKAADAVMFLKTTNIDPQRIHAFAYPGPAENKGIVGKLNLEADEIPMKPVGPIYDIEMFAFTTTLEKFIRDEDLRNPRTKSEGDAMTGPCPNCGTVHVPTVYKDGHEPQYATEGSAGADLFADISSDTIVLQPMKRILIPTGVQMQLPEGFELQIRPKSGLAKNHGVTVLNTPGTIDRDYTGIISVILINLGEEDFVITKGMKIAQAVLARYERMNNISVPDDTHFEKTDRGDGGFGSTGK